jgi:pyruvate dehydrogenase E1 component beta subunit
VKKTGRLVVADGGWRSFGVAAEVEAVVFEEALDYMKSPPVRVTLPDIPGPASRTLEAEYYPTVNDIVEAVKRVFDYSWTEINVPGTKSKSVQRD